MSQNYIFGYGSLIEDESRRRTTPTAVYAWPVRVKGIRRGWFARGASSGLTTTYLGALPDGASICNGVVYAVTDEDLQATDRRESAGYKRKKIDPADIQMLGGYRKPPAGAYWVYMNTFPPSELGSNIPSSQFPMVQSYVDICINGCLEIQGKYPEGAGNFASEFIKTTGEWSKLWVNDRLYPRRPFIYRPTAGTIDAVLTGSDKTRDLFYGIEIEPASYEDRKPVRPPTEPSASPRLAVAKACWEKGG